MIVTMAEEEYEEEGEDNVYNDEKRKEMLDNDELSPEEEGFLEGYDMDSEEEKEKEKEEETE